MSYVGEPFEYDVFVSYAHAEAETEAALILDWSRRATDVLRELLASALNVNVPADSKIRFIRDDTVLKAGQPLTETLREKVRHSALLLVLMSPLYPTKRWCLDELTWFVEQMERDGRSREHCTVLLIQPVAKDAWPKFLLDERGEPVFSCDLADGKTGLPVCIADDDVKLRQALLKPFIEIKGKLTALRNLLAARRRMAAPVTQKPPDRPVIYLDASPDEEALWRDLKAELKEVAIVRPATLAPANGDTDPLDRERQKERQRRFAESDGLVLLHGSRGSWLEQAVAVSYNDRRLLLQRHRNLPWAILDRVGARPPVADDYDVPCVPGTVGGWQRELLAALGLDPDARPAP